MSLLDTIQKRLDAMAESIEITDTKVGNFLIYKNDIIISDAIRLFGEYCHAEVDIMSDYITESSTYIDIGSNIGYHAIAIHKQTNCTVIGFEPNPKHFAIATFNAKDYDKIQLINAAASNHRQTFKMKDFNETLSGNYGDSHKSDTGDIEVHAIPLDELQINHCSVIKIDVEGHEYEVLQGCTQTISKYRPIILYEAMEWDAWTKCYDFLDERKYKQYWVTCSNKPLADTYKVTDENPFGHGSVANILCVPIEREQPNYLVPVTQYESFTDCVNRYRKLKILF